MNYFNIEFIFISAAAVLSIALITPAIWGLLKKNFKPFWLIAFFIVQGFFIGAINQVYYELKTIPRMTGSKPAVYWSETKLKSMIVREAMAAGFPPELAIQIAKQESYFKPRAVSNAQACGLFQIMPKTWLSFSTENETDIFDPELNTRVALRYLMYLKAKNVDYKGILQKYNAGEANYNCGEARLYAQKIWNKYVNKEG